jgi:hypothetical protein
MDKGHIPIVNITLPIPSYSYNKTINNFKNLDKTSNNKIKNIIRHYSLNYKFFVIRYIKYI